MNAEPNERISPKARQRLAALQRIPLASVQETVESKSSGDRGQWLCITCGALPQNQLEAGSHERKYPRHRFAWRSFVSGRIEAP